MFLRIAAGLLFVCLWTSIAMGDAEGLLISAGDLAGLTGDERPVLLDVRAQRDYAAGHLPGARLVDLNAWKRKSLAKDGLTARDYWSDQVGGLGINRDTPVVVYGGPVTSATRAWWTLKYLGVRDVAVLDGGIDAWVAAAGPLTREVVVVEKVDFEPQFQSDRLATLDEVKSIVSTDDDGPTIIDTRSVAEHTGTGGPGARKGRIPGAVHQEWTHFVTDDGRFKPVDQIEQILQERGLTPESKAITHCQSGGRASLNAFAMELAGYGPVKNYYCGWSEWSADSDTPVDK